MVYEAKCVVDHTHYSANLKPDFIPPRYADSGNEMVPEAESC
jgi:hypothetical protein